MEEKSNENERAGRFGRIKKTAALIGVIVLLGIYVVAFVAAIGKWENSHAVFMTAIYLSIAVPVIIYVMQLIYKAANKERDKDKKD